MSFKPIVVGVDASPEAAGAAVFALHMSQRAGTSCHLVHATRDAIVALPAVEVTRYRQALVDHAWTRIEEALRDKVPATLLDQVIVRLGPTAAVLRHAVASLEAELVVLGGKHHSTLGRWFGGSTSLNVARTAHVPLLVTAGPATTVRRVLVAVDLSGTASPTLVAAERYAALFGAELRVLSVFEPLPVIPEISPPYDLTDYYTLSEEQVQQEIWPLIRSPRAEKVVRRGMAVETIIGEATQWQADLLVVGSHGKGWAQRLLLGSVTERMLNHLPTSLLVIPALPAATVESAAPREAERRQPVVAIA
jgi:nucleotide-binding universal stress UspA family protein